MRYPIVHEDADVGIVEQVLSLEGLWIRGHYYGRIGWERTGWVRGATGQEGVVHEGDMGQGRGSGCGVCYRCEVKLCHHRQLTGECGRVADLTKRAFLRQVTTSGGREEDT